jgi:hypothetical protein
LIFEDAPELEVRAGDVLVRVAATGITPTELTWDETYQHADGTPQIPSIPGGFRNAMTMALSSSRSVQVGEPERILSGPIPIRGHRGAWSS